MFLSPIDVSFSLPPSHSKKKINKNILRPKTPHTFGDSSVRSELLGVIVKDTQGGETWGFPYAGGKGWVFLFG